MRTPLAFLLTVFLVGRCPAFAEDGHLDLTFGRGGKVTTDFPDSSVRVCGMAIQPDGKIVVAGSSTSFFPTTVTSVLARYNTDGSLDLTFGIEGKAWSRLFDGDYCVALGIQPDGKIIVLGNRAPFTTNIAGTGFMARYDSNGRLDTTFGDSTVGNGGTIIWPQNASALAIQSDGKIIVALGGYSDLSKEASVMRYNSDGMLDTAFGFGGRVQFHDPGMESRVSRIAIQPDGKIIAAGGVRNPSTSDVFVAGDLALARYNTNGDVDVAFGGGGVVRTGISAGYRPRDNALAIRSDGKILAAGPSSIYPSGNAIGYRNIAIVRYNSNGAPDTAFGADGKFITASWGESDLAIQADGKIIVGGSFPATSPNGNQFGLARYYDDGALDVTFGAGGIVNTDFSDRSYFFDCSGASAIAIQPDGKILAVGMSDFGWACAPAFAIARYNNDQSLPVDLRLDPERIRVGSSYVATFLGAGPTDETYFDLRFRSPIDERDQVTLNWQRGTSAMHVAGGTVPGTWTVTGVRPHKTVDDHSADFVPISATLTVVE